MSVSVIRRRLQKPPRLFRERRQKVIGAARKSPVPLRWRLLRCILKAGIGLTIIIWLVTVAWVVPAR